MAFLLPLGGANRVLVAVPAFAAGAVLYAVAASTLERSGWVAGLAYGAASIAVIYAMLVAIVLPLRLAISGTCPESSASCPLGFEHPATSGETLAVYSSVVLAFLALIAMATAVEARYLHRSRRSSQSLP